MHTDSHHNNHYVEPFVFLSRHIHMYTQKMTNFNLVPVTFLYVASYEITQKRINKCMKCAHLKTQTDK